MENFITTFFDLSKLKAIADDKIHVAKMIIYVFDRAENFGY